MHTVQKAQRKELYQGSLFPLIVRLQAIHRLNTGTYRHFPVLHSLCVKYFMKTFSNLHSIRSKIRRQTLSERNFILSNILFNPFSTNVPFM